MFRNEVEFAKAMLDGRQFTDINGNTYFVRWSDTGIEFLVRYTFSNIVCPITNFWSRYSEVTEILPWYERIPEQGVLCWVWDDQIPDARVVLIREYKPNARYPYNGMWGNAKPLTLDEVKQMIAEE